MAAKKKLESPPPVVIEEDFGNETIIQPLVPLQGIGEAVEQDGWGLPTQSTIRPVDPLSYRYLAITPPGWGKTEFFSSFEDSILLACEAGHKFVETQKIVITSWSKKPDETHDMDGNVIMSFTQAINAIISSDRFRFVIIDTVDALIKLITDATTKEHGVDHVSQMGDFGVGHDLGQNKPFRQIIEKLMHSGRGIAYTTHMEVKDVSTNKKEPKKKKETSLPNGIIKLLYPQVEVVLHGMFGGIREGHTKRDRIFKTEGSEEILAKNRGGILPPAFIVEHDIKKRWAQFQGFYTNPETVVSAYEEYKEFYSEVV